MSEELVQQVAKAIADRIGNGMSEKYEAHARAAIEALSSRPEGEAVANVMWGSSDEADFEKGTWTFSMEPGFRVGAGRYAIVFERDFFSAPPAAAEGVPADSVALAACRAVVEWCDKNPPAGSALWCVNLCRFAIAKAPAFSPVAASEPSLAMVGAQAGAVPAREYTDGRWHHGNGYLCMGTLRVARADFDTNPPEEFQTAFFEEMCAVLNAKATAAPPVDANKGGVPEGFKLVPLEPSKAMLDAAAPFPEHLRAQRSPEWAASMEAATIADQMVIRRNYIAMLSAAPAAPVAADEREQPMETAPRDGTEILVFFKRLGWKQVSWDSPHGDEYAIWCVDDNKYDPYPLRGYSDGDEVCWMPLPPDAALAARKADGKGGEQP